MSLQKWLTQNLSVLDFFCILHCTALSGASPRICLASFPLILLLSLRPFFLCLFNFLLPISLPNIHTLSNHQLHPLYSLVCMTSHMCRLHLPLPGLHLLVHSPFAPGSLTFALLSLICGSFSCLSDSFSLVLFYGSLFSVFP